MTKSLNQAAADAARAIEVATLRAALAEHRGNVRASAAALGVSADTLHRRIDAFDLRAWLTATFPRSARQPKKS